MKATGGCLCGQIKYEILKMNFKSYHCHCEFCQKSSGSICATYINLKAEHILWIGNEPSYYTSSTDGRRGFCNNCGSTICFENIKNKKVDICVGSLDQKSELVLVGHNGVESRLDNFSYEDNLPKYQTD